MHIYTLNNNVYPSVTTIIKLISGNDELMKWANYMGFKRRDITKFLSQSSAFGTRVHEFICGEVDKSAPVPLPFKDSIEEYEIKKIIGNFNKEFNNDYETLYTEKTIISEELGYGGTLDWLMKSNNKIILCDFKTSKKARDSMFLQLGGYNNLLKTISINVDGAMIITLNEFQCNKYYIDSDVLNALGNTFNLLFSFYKEWESITDKNNQIIKMNYK